jgi:hypothetical protein
MGWLNDNHSDRDMDETLDSSEKYIANILINEIEDINNNFCYPSANFDKELQDIKDLRAWGYYDNKDNDDVSLGEEDDLDYYKGFGYVKSSKSHSYADIKVNTEWILNEENPLEIVSIKDTNSHDNKNYACHSISVNIRNLENSTLI